MIVERKTIEFQDRKFAEYIKGKGHFKWRTSLNDTACFIYWLKGENKLYTHNNRINNSSKEALLLKCGTYLSEAIPDANQEVEAIIIHLYPGMRNHQVDWVDSLIACPPTLR